MTLIKQSPSEFLKPHLAALMTSLLDALSWTEHEKINYLAVRANDQEREEVVFKYFFCNAGKFAFHFFRLTKLE